MSAVPPRTTFSVQMAGTVVGALLNCACLQLHPGPYSVLKSVNLDVIMQTVVSNEREILVHPLHSYVDTRSLYIVAE